MVSHDRTVRSGPTPRSARSGSTPICWVRDDPRFGGPTVVFGLVMRSCSIWARTHPLNPVGGRCSITAQRRWRNRGAQAAFPDVPWRLGTIQRFLAELATSSRRGRMLQGQESPRSIRGRPDCGDYGQVGIG
jgi:hypothetical protein